MNIVLWVLQILVGLLFILAGFMKTIQPVARLAKQMDWVNHVQPWMVRFVGIAEFLGGVGLILPAATGIAPILTPLAAVGLAITMLCAALFHVRLGDYARIAPSIVLLVLSVVLVVGRFAIAPL